MWNEDHRQFPQIAPVFADGRLFAGGVAAVRRGDLARAAGKRREADAAEYDFSREILPVLEEFYRSPDRAARAHASLSKQVQGISTVLQRVGPSAGGRRRFISAHAAVRAGRRRSAAGRLYCSASKKLLELGWERGADMAVARHELGHLWHFEMRTAPAW